MESKKTSVIMVIMLFMGTLTLASSVQPVKSELKTWIVDDDGLADFSKIQEAVNAANPGDTVFVKAGTYYEHVVVDKSLTLTGQDPSVTVNDGNGSGKVITVQADNVQISQLTIQNGEIGIYVDNSSKNKVQENKLIKNVCGIMLGGSSDYNTICRNNITGMSNITAKEFEGLYGVCVGPNEIESASFEPPWPSSNNVTNNVITNNLGGITIYGSPNNVVSGNTLTDNGDGIETIGSYHTLISNNCIAKGWKGIWDAYSAFDTISNNTISDIVQFGIGPGIGLGDSHNTSVTSNTVSSSDIGILLITTSLLHHNNAIIGNSLSNNMIGMRFTWNVSDDRIFHNNFINNTLQVHDKSWNDPLIPPSINIWDDGYPSGGNYWSDYTCEDFYKGPYQNISGSDGIWDHPYVIDTKNRDNYPLVEPWTPFPTTIGELQAKIKELGSEGKIDNQGIVKSLIAKLDVAQKLVNKEKTDEAKAVLGGFITQVHELSGIHITIEAVGILTKSAEFITLSLLFDS